MYSIKCYIQERNNLYTFRYTNNLGKKIEYKISQIYLEDNQMSEDILKLNNILKIRNHDNLCKDFLHQNVHVVNVSELECQIIERISSLNMV